MRHNKSFNHLGRQAGHRRAMLSNMAASLILHKKIKTTTAKAKALRVYVEPLITKSKEDSTNSRRVVFSYLQDKEAVTELFREISPKIIDRPGGYTRILKTGTRLGDSADMCIIELVDYNETYISSKDDTKTSKSARRRRKPGKKDAEVTVIPVKAVKKDSDVVEQKVTEDVILADNAPEADAEIEVKDETEDKKEE
jgi:large subunit ribosomal protein L17